MKRVIFLFLGLLSLFLLFSCSFDTDFSDSKTQQLNVELSKMFDIYQRALLSSDSATVEEMEEFLADFDQKYDSDLSVKFSEKKAEISTDRLSSGDSYPPLYDLPFNTDGAVYLSGGKGSIVSAVIEFVSPLSTQGEYYHGGVFDLNKFDPTNLDTPCVQTAVTKGAGYETAMDWMTKTNVTVMNPKNTLNAAALNSAQQNIDYYCDPNNTNMQYGFFKSYVNVAEIVTKSDNYYWYCTKVAWRVYNLLGIDIDSNSDNIDWTTSGLYDAVAAYYYTIYFYNWSKARDKINAYMTYAKTNLVLAEEIYFSPYLTKVYEIIRE